MTVRHFCQIVMNYADCSLSKVFYVGLSPRGAEGDLSWCTLPECSSEHLCSQLVMKYIWIWEEVNCTAEATLKKTHFLFHIFFSFALWFTLTMKWWFFFFFKAKVGVRTLSTMLIFSTHNCLLNIFMAVF